jgi:hypothetical protein
VLPIRRRRDDAKPAISLPALDASLFFGTDHFTFQITSNNPPAVPPTRTYQRFSDAAQDVVDARIYQGIHFRFADTAARRQGLRVARWAFQHFLRPVDGDDHDCDEGDDGDDDDEGED